MRTITRSLLLSLSLLLVPAASGCGSSGSSSSATAENLEEAADTVTEEYDDGIVSLFVGDDGKIKVLVKGTDGKPIENPTATVTVGGASGTPVPLKVDEKSKLLVGDGPKLSGELTEVRYTIKGGSKTWTGVLHLPPEGTAGIEANAKKAESKPVPTDKPGPNGGVVQVAGDDIIEVVADKGSGQVRVYVLDGDLKPIAVGNRKIKLALQGGTTEVIDLSPNPDNIYFTGRVASRTDPTKLTVAVSTGSKVVVVLVGHGKGKRVVVTPGKGPPVKLMVVGPRWTDGKPDKKDDDRKDDRKDKDDDRKDKKDKDDHKGKGKDKDDHKGKGPKK